MREETQIEHTRKERSDKKIAIAPTVHLELYDFLVRVAYLVEKPFKSVGEEIVTRSLRSKQVIEIISTRFRKEFWFEDGQRLYRGNLNRDPYRFPLREKKKRLPNLKFRKEIHSTLHDLSYALNTTVSQATAFVLSTAVHETDLVDRYIGFYIETELLDAKRMKQLHAIMDYLNRNRRQRVTYGELLNHFARELHAKGKALKEAIGDWLDSYVDEE